MCVIMVCKEARPTLEMLKQAEEENKDGAGIAWIENGRVRYEKNRTKEQVAERMERVAFPFVIHFRLATVGEDRLLTHPFPVDRGATLAMEGTADRVLFHNGHWREWNEKCLQTAIRRGLKVPRGRWSDSRAMAWLASIYGTGILEFVDQKIALMSKEGVEFFGSYWTEEKGIVFSNTSLLYPERAVGFGSWERDKKGGWTRGLYNEVV